MLYIQKETGFEPYSLRQLYKDRPNVSFPETVTDETLADYNVVRVIAAPRPEVADPQIAERNAEPTQQPDGTWVLDWTVRDKTPEELEADLKTKRKMLSVERWSFAGAAMAAGIITSDEAQAWGPGNALPASVEAALSDAIADPSALAMAKVRALAAPRINRLNPLVEALRERLDLTPEQTDELFAAAKLLEAE